MNVILDADTAHPDLIVSDDGKQVKSGNTQTERVDGGKDRFVKYLGVVGKEGFSSGCFYFEVQVKGRTEWDLGGSGYILANRLPTTSSNRQSKLWYTPFTNTRWVTRKAQCYFLFSQHGTIERHKARGLRSKRRGTS